MRNKCSKPVDQNIVSGRPRKFRKLAAFAVLLALGSGGPAYAATCEGVTATKVGTNEAETIMGTAGRDVVQARDGNDVIYGLEGNDVICGSLGDDFIYGGYGDLASAPTLSGNDRLNGGDNEDTLFGENGNDILDGSCPCPFRESPVKDTCDGGSGTRDVAQNCEIKTGFP